MQNNTSYTVTCMPWSHAEKDLSTGVRRKLKQFYIFFQILHVGLRSKITACLITLQVCVWT